MFTKVETKRIMNTGGFQSIDRLRQSFAGKHLLSAYELG